MERWSGVYQRNAGQVGLGLTILMRTFGVRFGLKAPADGESHALPHSPLRLLLVLKCLA